MIFLLIIGFMIAVIGFTFYMQANENKGRRLFLEDKSSKKAQEEYIKDFIKSERNASSKIIVVGFLISLVSLIIIASSSSEEDYLVGGTKSLMKCQIKDIIIF